ncbi:MAG: FecR domain-containing protein [Candidatus Azobacteroides sp.]|nr:FecR domain-containing protein [Candidatus Azobacteroides sp.]
MADEYAPINTENTSFINPALIVKYLQKSTNPEETLCVEAWINESETNRKEVSRMAELLFTKRAYDRMTSRNVDLAYQKVQRRLHDKSVGKKVSFGRRSFLYVAASIIGAIILSSTYIYLRENHIHSVEPNYLTVESNPGVRTRILLSDGTIVHLNFGSKLTYPDQFFGNSREVKLDGEAYFQVKSDRNKPFIVRTNEDNATIQALGTAFNVQNFDSDDEFTTTLVEGSVNITVNHPLGSSTRMELTPSDKIIFNKKSDSLSIVKTDTEIETSWINDRLIFRNQSMPQVLKTLAYNFNAEFEIRNPAIYAYRFTGTFQSRQLSQILEYIKISSDINYTIRFPRSDDSRETNKTRVILN